MIYFNNDYSEGCHPEILKALAQTNLEQSSGYGTDGHCAAAAAKIRAICQDDTLAVHFLVGGTQANLTVIAAALRPHQGAIGADTAHINCHETGSIEATGHKVLAIPGKDGKITARQIKYLVLAHRADESFEHTVQPKLVYLSTPTELGTLYTLDELEAISSICRELGLYLFVDGARLGYGLAAKGNDVTLPDLARLCDVFYIGGTKVGAMFGEAVVFTNMKAPRYMFTIIKRHGALLAKGRMLGLQFDTLFTDNLYLRVARYAIEKAYEVRQCFLNHGLSMGVDSPTNQQFVILSVAQKEQLMQRIAFEVWCARPDGNLLCRFVTSWATTDDDIQQLNQALTEVVG